AGSRRLLPGPKRTATRRRPMTAEPTRTMSSAPHPLPAPGPAKPLRLRAPVAFVAVYWTAHFVVGRLEKFYFVGFVFNLASSALLAILFTAWWWANRRVPLRNRLYGFLLIVGGALIAEPFAHESIGWWGLFMTGLPVVLTAWVLWMIVAMKVGTS